MLRKQNAWLSGIVGGVLLASAPAQAAFMAYIADDALVTGGGDTIVTDQGAGDNFPGSAVVGQINSGAVSVAGFNIITNVGQSKPLIGSAALPQLNLDFSAATTDNATHTVFLYLSDTGFTGAGGYILSFGGTQSGSGNSISGQAYGGTTNTNLNLTSPLGGALTSTGSAFAVSQPNFISPIVNPYGLTIGVAITRTTAGTTSGSLNFSLVPEPATGLAILGLFTLPLARRRGR